MSVAASQSNNSFGDEERQTDNLEEQYHKLLFIDGSIKRGGPSQSTNVFADTSVL